MTGPEAVLGQCVGLWDGTPGTLVPVRQGANFVYEFQARNCRLFLRVTRDHHRSHEQLEAELDFVRFVASRGVDVSGPQPSRRGNCVETLDTGGSETWHAVVFAAAAGRHFRFFTADIDGTLFRAWGRAMGALHLASRDFVPGASRRRPTWSEQDTTSCDPAMIPADEVEAMYEYERISEWLATRPATSANWGLIHGDFERTNFVLADGSLCLFDFDDACYHWYVADIAHALWAFRGAPSPDRSRFLEWFLEGYRELCLIDGDVRNQLTWFVRLRTLSLFVARLHEESSADWVRRTRLLMKTPFHW